MTPDASLPRQLTGGRSPLIWGVALLVVIEGTLLSLFVLTYFYLRLGVPEWPPPDVGTPDLLLPTAAQLCLLASPLPFWLGLQRVARPDAGRSPLGLPAALPLGMGLALAYLLFTVWSYAGREYTWTTHVYGSLDWSMSAYAALHVATVVLAGAFVWLLAVRGHFGPHRYTGLQALLVYWIFVALGSLLFYGVQYLAPYAQ